MSAELVAAGLVAIFGLVMGSAVSALAWRLPRGESWVRGRSACPACGHVLGVADLVPLFSWLASRGRCRHCGERVSWRYPATELACSAWAVMAWLQRGPTPEFALLAMWGFLLVTLLWIDLDLQLLPDALTLPGTLIGIAIALLGPGARHALLGIVLGSGLLWLVGELYFRVRKIEGMGGGDVKLAAMFGAVLGPGGAVLTILLASIAGAAWGGVLIARGRGDGRTALPFGTLLCPAAMVACLWGDGWIQAYLSLFQR